MVGAIVRSPTDAVSQEAVVGSAQHVVWTRARASRDAVVRHYNYYVVGAIKEEQYYLCNATYGASSS